MKKQFLKKKIGLFSCCTLNSNGIIIFQNGKIFSKNNLPMKTKPDQKFSGKLFFPLFFRRRRTLKQNENQTNSIELDTNFFSPILLLLMLYWNEQQTKQKITMWFMKWTREKERKKKVLFCPKGKIIYVMRFVSKMWNYSIKKIQVWPAYTIFFWYEMMVGYKSKFVVWWTLHHYKLTSVTMLLLLLLLQPHVMPIDPAS